MTEKRYRIDVTLGSPAGEPGAHDFSSIWFHVHLPDCVRAIEFHIAEGSPTFSTEAEAEKYYQEGGELYAAENYDEVVSAALTPKPDSE